MRKALATLGLTAALTMILSGCSSQKSAESGTQEGSPSPTSSLTADPVGTWGTEGSDGIEPVSNPWLSIYEDGRFFASDGCLIGQGSWRETDAGFDLALVNSMAVDDSCERSWVGLMDSMVPSEKSMVLLDSESNELEKLSFLSKDPSLTQNEDEAS